MMCQLWTDIHPKADKHSPVDEVIYAKLNPIVTSQVPTKRALLNDQLSSLFNVFFTKPPSLISVWVKALCYFIIHYADDELPELLYGSDNQLGHSGSPSVSTTIVKVVW